tara:strand:+ start:3665 stop:4639 length:975 start_codon:yes stop_codon:yes gene_type:complete
MSEKKLEEIMSKDKSLVRRVSDIEVEEVTLTKKGALGDEADAVILYKEDEKETPEVKEEVAELEKEQWIEETTEEVVEETAELEKEDIAEEATDGKAEMDFDSAISFIQKGELTDEQKQSVLDTALVMFDAADLEKEEDSVPKWEGMVFQTDQRLTSDQAAALQKQLKEQHEACDKSGEPMVVHSGVKLSKGGEFSEEAMQLLKSIHESIEQRLPAAALEKELPEQFKKKKKKKSDSDDDDSEESAEDKEDKKPDFLKKEEDSVVDTVEQLLRKSQEAKLAKEQSDKEAAFTNKLNEMSSVLSGLTEKFTETQRRLSRECGIDA